MHRIIVFSVYVYCGCITLFAADFTDAANGLWNDGATWGNVSPGAEGVDWPGTTDNVTISTYTVTLGAASACNNLTISGGWLDTDNANNYSLNIANDFVLTSGRIYFNASTITVGRHFNSSVVGGVRNGTSTVILTGTGDLINAGNGNYPSFYNLSMAAAGQTTTIKGGITINNHFTLGAGNITQDAFREITLLACPGNPITDVGANWSLSALNYRSTPQIANINYSGIGRIRLHPSTTVYELTGDLTIPTLHISAQNASGGLAVLDTKGFNLTVTSNLVLGEGGAASTFTGKLIANNSIITTPNFKFNASSGDPSGPPDTLIGGSAVFNISGNWINEAGGYFDCGTSTVNLVGTASQNVRIAGVIGGETFYNLTVNNTRAGNAVVFTGDVNVANSLTLTDGHIITSSSALLTINDGASVTLNAPVTQDSSFVKGPVKKTGADDFTFPIGSIKQYRPIAISNLSGSDVFTAEYIKDDPQNVPYDIYSRESGINHVSRCEYWMLDRLGGESADVTLSWNTYSCGVTDLADLRVARWDGSEWKDHGNGGTTGNTTQGTIVTSAAVTSFSPFTLASSSVQNPLPVEMLSFTAFADINVVNIEWSTSSEVNNAFFTVERSKDGIVFEKIMDIKGAGNSISLLQYFAVDKTPFSGISYYRLRQTDFDGYYKYSQIVSVNFSKPENNYLLFPNPSKGVVFMKTDNSSAVVITVYDISGREIIQKKVEPSIDVVEVITAEDKINPGTYLVKINSGNAFSRQLLVVK